MWLEGVDGQPLGEINQEVEEANEKAKTKITVENYNRMRREGRIKEANDMIERRKSSLTRKDISHHH